MTTDPTQDADAGPAEGAAPASPKPPTNSSTKGGSRDAKKQKKQSPYSLRLLDELFKSRSDEDMKNDKFTFLPIFVCFAIIAPIMLVGLPLGALGIVHYTKCCTNESVASFFTFWGSVLGGMLALFGILIAAVFVITALRIDKSAKVEAQTAAVKAVGQFMLKYKREFLKQTDRWLRKLRKVKDKAVASIETAREAAESNIETAKLAAESRSKAAIAEIEKAQGGVDKKAQQATEAMDQAVRGVENEKTAAVERIGAKVAEFERSVGQTVEEARARVDAAVADVERAAAEARARIEGQQGRDPSSGGSP